MLDAELVGIAGAWEEGYNTVASDSQAAIGSSLNLATGAQDSRSWIDERAMKALKQLNRKAELMWVKGHIGIEGNE